MATETLYYRIHAWKGTGPEVHIEIVAHADHQRRKQQLTLTRDEAVKLRDCLDGAIGSRDMIDQYHKILSRSVEEMELSMRSYNCLKNARIETIGDLVRHTEKDILRIKNLGRKSLNELREILGIIGLEFGMSGAEDLQ